MRCPFFGIFPQVPPGTIKTWLYHFQNKKQYHAPSKVKHGRPAFLSEDQKAAVVDSVVMMGSTPNGFAVRCRTVAAIARGVVSRTSPQVLHDQQVRERMFLVCSRFCKSTEEAERWASIGPAVSCNALG
jgi:hypothetical protein